MTDDDKVVESELPVHDAARTSRLAVEAEIARAEQAEDAGPVDTAESVQADSEGDTAAEAEAKGWSRTPVETPVAAEVAEENQDQADASEEDQTAAEKVEEIRSSDSPEEVRSLAEGDSRKTVRRAAEQRLSALEDESKADLRDVDNE